MKYVRKPEGKYNTRDKLHNLKNVIQATLSFTLKFKIYQLEPTIIKY